MRIIEHHRRIEGIPVIEFFPAQPAGKLPVVIMMHGFSGCKEDNIPVARQLAGLGFSTLSIDLHLHGELGMQPFVAAAVSPRFAEVVEQSVANLARLVEAYPRQAGETADASRIGLLGISLGGAVIHGYLPRRSAAVKAAVSLVAGLSPFMGETFRAIQRVYPDFAVTDSLISSLSAWGQAAPLLENVSDFPLLWQYGVDDPIIPIRRVRDAFLQIRARYSHPERVELVEYERCGHETPPAMYERAAAWLARFL